MRSTTKLTPEANDETYRCVVCSFRHPCPFPSKLDHWSLAVLCTCACAVDDRKPRLTPSSDLLCPTQRNVHPSIDDDAATQPRTPSIATLLASNPRKRRRGFRHACREDLQARKRIRESEAKQRHSAIEAASHVLDQSEVRDERRLQARDADGDVLMLDAPPSHGADDDDALWRHHWRTKVDARSYCLSCTQASRRTSDDVDDDGYWSGSDGGLEVGRYEQWR